MNGKPLPLPKPASGDGEGPMTTSDSGADSGVRPVDKTGDRRASGGGGGEEVERCAWAEACLRRPRVSLFLLKNFCLWARVVFWADIIGFKFVVSGLFLFLLFGFVLLVWPRAKMGSYT
ncbi:uncharacterized protein [Gossypium hirsutum]|uniref:Uncharacterized protein n=1 Tax=Gossypium hirsutum TaxID=3635 RepID=A0ABM3B136_GOSHI|nr:uncharacterized protein LOC121223415 [Gossypium hirsutum]